MAIKFNLPEPEQKPKWVPYPKPKPAPLPDPTAEPISKAAPKPRKPVAITGSEVISKPPKQLVSIRLDQDVLAALKAGGDGWQTRLNTLLRREFGLGTNIIRR